MTLDKSIRLSGGRCHFIITADIERVWYAIRFTKLSSLTVRLVLLVQFYMQRNMSPDKCDKDFLK